MTKLSPPSSSPTLAQVVLAAFLVNLVPTATGVLAHTYDAETHLFFADHYANGWFDGWEPRWYGGFWVYSYPPLLHQLVALVGKFTDLETAYRCVQLGVLIALPLSVWLLAEAVAGAQAAGWAAAFAVASAGAYSTVYTFGQLPTLTALVLMLAATTYLLRYIVGGRPLDLVAWTGLGGACVATHHLTGMVGQPLLAVTALLHVALRPSRSGDPPLARLVTRAVIAALTFGAMATTALYPFFWWSSHGRVPQAEIPHLTRTAFLSNEVDRWPLVQGEWGIVPLLVPFVVWACIKQRPLWAWTGLVALLATLYLGPAYTSLPRLMFPGLAYWLTYERFALWGAIVALVPFGAWAAGARARPLAIALLPLSAHVALQAATYTAHRPVVDGMENPALVSTVAGWLSSHGRDRWRYVTFHFAEGDMPRLSRLTTAPSIDGTYFTARRDPLLSRSGVACVDTVASQGADKVAFVRMVLSTPERYNLRWAICASTESARLVRMAGWTCLGTMKGFGLEPTADPDHPPEMGVTVWMAPGRCQVPPLDLETPWAPPALAFIWGLAPLSLLALGLVAGRRAWRDATGAESETETEAETEAA